MRWGTRPDARMQSGRRPPAPPRLCAASLLASVRRLGAARIEAEVERSKQRGRGLQKSRRVRVTVDHGCELERVEFTAELDRGRRGLGGGSRAPATPCQA